MILKLRVEHMKDATNETKRVLFATLLTEIVGMEQINAVSELDEECTLGREVTKMITDMLALKQAELKAKHKKLPAKNKK